MDENVDGDPSTPINGDAAPPAPMVTVYGLVVETGNDVAVLNPPAPPPPPPEEPKTDVEPPPPPPPTTRYSTLDPKVPNELTSKVPDEVKICAL